MAKSLLRVQVVGKIDPSTNDHIKGGDWLGIYLNPNNGGEEIEIHETSSTNRTVKGLFIGGSTFQRDATKMLDKFNQDWKNVGGYGNVKVTYRPDIHESVFDFELQNPLWTFGAVHGGGIANGKITVLSKVNAPAPTPKTVTLSQTSTVDCTNKKITYSAVITGGSGTYKIKGTANGNVASTGTTNIQLFRGIATNIVVVDSLGATIGTVLLTPPIRIDTSYFDIVVVQDGASPKATVSANVALPRSILPLKYSLDDSVYQSSGSFPDLDFEEVYTVYIKDVFGCKISKTFSTPADSGSTEPEVYKRYALISNAGTLIFKKHTNFSSAVKKNFTNILPCEEIARLPYGTIQEFDTGDTIVQQFKSSYDINKVTLVTDNGGREIVPVMQSQNLRLREKVDCKLFRDPYGGLGVYFTNGNSYEPDTTTVTGASDYDDTNFPPWARIGQSIKIDGVGTVSIKRIVSDSTQGLYIQTNTSYTSLTVDDGKVQASYNKQDYNTFEFGFEMSKINIWGRIIVEMGFASATGNLIEVTFVSEVIKPITDTCSRFLIQWNDPENKSGIVHQTGITHMARLGMQFTMLTRSESELYRSDSDALNLNQNAYRYAKLRMAVKGHAMENKIMRASGMENFLVNGINYRKKSMTSEVQGASNIYVLDGEFETGGNNLNVNADELVLHRPLEGLTNKPSIPSVIPTAIEIINGGLLLNGEGGAVLIDYS